MLKPFRDTLSFTFVDILAVAERLTACPCRHLALDGEDLTGAALADLATSAGLP